MVLAGFGFVSSKITNDPWLWSCDLPWPMDAANLNLVIGLLHRAALSGLALPQILACTSHTRYSYALDCCGVFRVFGPVNQVPFLGATCVAAV